MQDMQAPAAADATKRPTTAEKIKPLVVEPNVNGGWQGIGTIRINSELYQAAFKLSRVGYVDIPDNEIRFAAKDPSGATEGFLDGVRAPYTVEMGVEYLRDRDDGIEKLPEFYSEHKRWKDAADRAAKAGRVDAQPRRWTTRSGERSCGEST